MTGLVGLGGVPAAFDALADPNRHAQILIDPSQDGDQIRTAGTATGSIS